MTRRSTEGRVFQDILFPILGEMIGYRGKWEQKSLQYSQGLYPKDNRQFGRLLDEYLMSFPIKKVGFSTFESLNEGEWYLVYMEDSGNPGYKFEGRPFALYYLYENNPFETGLYVRLYGVKHMDSARNYRIEGHSFFVNCNYRKKEWASVDDENYNKRFGFVPLKKPTTFINWYRKNPFEVKS